VNFGAKKFDWWKIKEFDWFVNVPKDGHYFENERSQ
jgi:hypothetical protein